MVSFKSINISDLLISDNNYSYKKLIKYIIILYTLLFQVTRPDGQSESLGLTLLDEPSTKQSDPHVLDL